MQETNAWNLSYTLSRPVFKWWFYGSELIYMNNEQFKDLYFCICMYGLI